MKTEVARKSIRLSHFTPGAEGANFLRERLKERVANPPAQPTLEEAQRARDASHLRAADRFIQYTINLVAPGKRNSIDLLNNTTLLAPDTQRALRVLDANGSITERLKFEIVRKMLLAGIASELEARSISHQLREELYDVQALLDKELFTGQVGQTWTTTTYAVHSSRTNELKSVHDTYPWWIKPRHRVKKFVQESRYVEGVGYVLSSVREKSQEASIEKALRRAVQNRIKTGNDQLDVLGSVKDAMGLMFVVKGTMRSTDNRVATLRDKVLTTLREKYGEIQVEMDSENGSKEHAGQKTHAQYQRILVKVDSLPVPIELMFYGEGDYINDTYNVGKRDPKTREYSGNAHRLFEIQRLRTSLPIIYPESIRGYEGLDAEALKTMHAEAKKLRREKRVPVIRGLAERVTSRADYRQQRRAGLPQKAEAQQAVSV